MTQVDTFSLDMTDSGFVDDPYPTYRRLREHAPLWESSFGVTIASRYKDCAFMFRDPRFSVTDPYFGDDPSVAGLGAMLGEVLAFTGPPLHHDRRAATNKSFTPRRIAQIQPLIDQLLNEIVSEHLESTIDLVADLAHPISTAVISSLLGVPRSDYAEFQARSAPLGLTMDPVNLPSHLPEVMESVTWFIQYLDNLLAERRRHPGESLIDDLLAQEHTGVLAGPALVQNVLLPFAAGFETTVKLLGNAVLTLVSHPDRAALLRADPSLCTNAVEEFFRFEGPAQVSNTPRRTTEDVAFGDVVVPAGTNMRMHVAAANRDPAQLEHPDVFDVRREGIKHLGLGAGIHFCLGAGLARAEAVSFLRRLYCADLEAHVEGKPQWITQLFLRGLASCSIGITGRPR